MDNPFYFEAESFWHNYLFSTGQNYGLRSIASDVSGLKAFYEEVPLDDGTGDFFIGGGPACELYHHSPYSPWIYSGNGNFQLERMFWNVNH